MGNFCCNFGGRRGGEGGGVWVHSGEFFCHLVVEHLGQADATCGFMTFDHTHRHTEVNQNGYKYRDLICCFMRDVENQDSLFCVHFIEIDLQAQKANVRFYNWRQGPEPEFNSEKETLCSVSAVKQSTLSNLHTHKNKQTKP